MKFVKTVIVMLFTVLFYVNSFAAEYFLSPEGIDNSSRNGSADMPWRTLNWAAANKLASGDTLTCLPGVYGKSFMNQAAFDIQNKVLIRSSELHAAQFGLDWVGNSSGIIFDGFDFTNCGKTETNVLQLDKCHNLIVRNCVIHDGLDGGDLLKINNDAHDIVIEGCELYNPGTRYREGSWGGYETETYQENIDIYDAWDITIRKCWIYHIGNRGDHIAYVKGAGYNIIFEENVIGPQSTSAHEGALSAGSVSTGVTGDGYCALDVTMRNNVIIDCGYAGIGLYASKNVDIVGNVLYNCGFRETPEAPQYQAPSPYITPPSPIIFRKTIGGQVQGQNEDVQFKINTNTRIDSNIIIGLGNMGAVVTKPEDDMILENIVHTSNTYWNSGMPVSSDGVYDPNSETSAILDDPLFPDARSVDVYTDSYETIWSMFNPTTSVEQLATEMPPQDFVLEKNYPNPFNSSTVITYSIKRQEGAEASLAIYNILGKVVREYKTIYTEMGHHHVTWDGTDFYGMLVPTGVYFYRLQVGAQIAYRRMMMIK